MQLTDHKLVLWQILPFVLGFVQLAILGTIALLAKQATRWTVQVAIIDILPTFALAVYMLIALIESSETSRAIFSALCYLAVLVAVSFGSIRSIRKI